MFRDVRGDPARFVPRQQTRCGSATGLLFEVPEAVRRLVAASWMIF
jgi:hypothetical protein